ncbi:hypothetical protein ACQEU8_18660 [Streptomyces sp. CA-250714]|uniref:hypothetical protein n=1 Tax=Streptomyces sp. CA-250714 TaxID=3240060 RepID=UPI003D8C759F
MSVEESLVVKDAVQRAYWSVYSRSSWDSAVKDLLSRHARLIIVVGVLLWVPTAYALESLFGKIEIFDEQVLKVLSGGHYFLFLALLLAVLICYARVFVMLLRVSYWAAVAWRIAVGVSCVLLFILPEWMSAVTDQVRRNTVWVSGVLTSDELFWGALVEQAAKLIVFGTAFVSAQEIGRAASRRFGHKEPRGVIPSARILLELLDLAEISQRAYGGSFVVGERQLSPSYGFRPYVASPQRVMLVASLLRIERIAQTSWKRELKTGDRESDVAVINNAEGIAESARRWRAVAARGGDDLADMRSNFARALVDVAQGRWSSLASEVSPRDLTSRRILRVIRRALALGFMAASVLLIVVKPYGVLGGAPQPAIDSLLLVLAGTICLVIDPGIGQRVGAAANLMGHFSGKSSK